MAKSLVNLDMGGWEIQNVVFQNLGSAPATVKTGWVYYDTSSNHFVGYNGTEWLPLDSQGRVYTFSTGLTETTGTVTLNKATTSALGGVIIGSNITLSSGTISISSSNITNALGYTPYNSTNPAGYITSAALAPYVLNTTTINGYALSSNITLTYSDVGALSSSTTINDLTTSAQQTALNSGANSTNITQIGTNTTDIATINGKIPSQASTTNQLADKDFVNSSISTQTAYFDGSWNTYADIPTTASAFESAGYPTPTNNNYLVVKEDETQDGGTWRYKYVDTGGTYSKNNWHAEYEVNETPLTAAQLAALNSGITDTLVAQITTNQNDISSLQQTAVTASSTTTFTNKTFDAEGTGNSITNLKTSNFKSGVIVTEVGSTGSDTSIPTEQAVREALTTLNNSVVHKLAVNNGALTQSGGICTWTISNTLATADVVISVYELSTGSEVMCDIMTSNSTITIKINSASNISADTYKAVIIG